MICFRWAVVSIYRGQCPTNEEALTAKGRLCTAMKNKQNIRWCGCWAAQSSVLFFVFFFWSAQSRCFSRFTSALTDRTHLMFAADVCVHFGPDCLRAEQNSWAVTFLGEVSLPHCCDNLCLCLPEFVNVWGRILTQVLHIRVMSLWFLAAFVGFVSFAHVTCGFCMIFFFSSYYLPERLDLTH